jgi:hypothetical protein
LDGNKVTAISSAKEKIKRDPKNKKGSRFILQAPATYIIVIVFMAIEGEQLIDNNKRKYSSACAASVLCRDDASLFLFGTIKGKSSVGAIMAEK